MAPPQPNPSLDDFIQKGREKRRNEALAQEIFGKGRPEPARRARTPQPPGGSLLNRVTKPGATRSVSSSNIHRPHIQNTQNPLFQRTHGANAASGRGVVSPGFGKQVGTSEFNIRGRAGPYVVIGSNFAPGTSELDIQATMEPIGGLMVSCALLTTRPTVIAEMVFKEKSGADAVVARFNNQMADGRLLHFYTKTGPPQTPITPSEPSLASIARTGRSTLSESSPAKERSLSEPSLGESLGRLTNEPNGRKADPTVQDGTMGFPNAQDESMDVDQGSEPQSSERRGYSNRGRGHSRQGDRYDDRRGYRNDAPRSRDAPREYDNRRPREDQSLYSDRHPRRGNRDGYR